jgi:predicted CXXCH cytochrome family protein
MKMRLRRRLTAFALSLASSAAAYTGSYVPGVGINGTVHDLATPHNGMNYSASPSDSLQRICVYCHAPHHDYKLSPANGGPGASIGTSTQAPDAFEYLPLWNHELTGNYAAYTMYQKGPAGPVGGPTASQAVVVASDPGATSLLCLSCHDGSVAVNSYGNGSQLAGSRSTGGTTISNAYLIGKDNDLSNHHPVGFDYDAVAAVDPEIRDADVATFGAAGTVREHLQGPDNSRLECPTCHAVHNTGNTGERLLWRSDVNSQLCLTCHDKGDDPGAMTP